MVSFLIGSGGFAYHPIEGVVGEGVTREGFPEHLIYIVQFLVVLAIAITILSLVRSGLLWMVSEGDPLKIKNAKEQLVSALMGFLIILSSYLILSALDPLLVEVGDVSLQEKDEEVFPGVHFSFEDEFNEEGEVYRATAPVRNLEELGEELRSFRIINQTDEEGDLVGYYYGVVLHEDPSYRGRCEFFVNTDPDPKDFEVPGEFSSVTVVRISENYHPREESYVKVYELPDFREEGGVERLDAQERGLTPLSLEEVWSMDIKGRYGIVLSSGDSWETTKEGCGVFLNSKPIADLKGHHMNTCDPLEGAPLFASYKSCATHYVAFPLF